MFANSRVYTSQPINPDYENRVREVFQRAGLMKHLQMKVATVKPGFVEVHLPFHQGVR
jgi:acyl-coenzyme A thioesterase PaaI-like protein